MSSWLWVVLILVIAAIGAMAWTRMRSARALSEQGDLGIDAPTPRDYAQEREDLRSSSLSVEDRAWETASLQRERDSRPKTPPVE